MVTCPKCFSVLTSCAGKCSCGFDLEESSAVDLTPLAADVPSEIPDLISMRQHPLWEEAYFTYPDHVKQLILLALGRNDPAAQLRLGLMYKSGDDGVKQSYTEAFKWFSLAAEQGNAEAQCDLGAMFWIGAGTEQSYIEALKWLHRAAEQKNAAAQCALGVMYRNGDGVEQNDSEAFKWFSLAAEQGNAIAQRGLGLMYVTGNGVKVNYAEACRWLHLAAEQEDAGAQCALGVMYRNGDGVEQSDREAFKWFSLAAEQGNAEAQRELGLMYGDGDGVELNFGEAYRWLDLAAKQGDIIALLCIGELFAMIADDCEERKGRDEERKWCRWAAAYNHIPSMERLMDGLLDMDTRRGREEALYWQFHLMIAEDDVAALTYEQVQRRLEEMEAYQDE